MPRQPPSLDALLDRLEALHGRARRPLPKSALDWVLWENAGYLVPDEKRARAWRALKELAGPRAAGILSVPRDELRELAALGGMMPDGRVSKWIRIAETVRDAFDGDLESALKLPLPKARTALERFPGIGAPGADKILLFTKTHALPALESNGLRTLLRLGYAEEAKSYSTTYRRAIEALTPWAERGAPFLMRAFQLLRRHGQELCKDKRPRCEACSLAAECPSAEE